MGLGGCQGPPPPPAAARPSEDRLRLCCLRSSRGHSCLVAGYKCRVNFGDTIVISQLIWCSAEQAGSLMSYLPSKFPV